MASPAVPQPDYRALFESVPGRYLALRPDPPRFTILAASDAYLRAALAERESVVGRGFFEFFPANPADRDTAGVRDLRTSLERVIRDRQPDAMAVQKYDVRLPKERGGGFEPRYWSPLNSPVCDAQGRMTCILHRVEDVTDVIQLERANERRGSGESRGTVDRPCGADRGYDGIAQTLQSRAAQVESERYLRAREVQELNDRLLVVKDHLRLALQAAQMIAWEWDLATGQLSTLGDVESLSSMRAAPTAEDAWQHIHPEDVEPFQQALRRAVEQGGALQHQFRMRGSDRCGTTWVEVHACAIASEGGRTVQVTGVMRDIDHWKQVQQEQQEAVRQFRLLANSIPQLVWMARADGYVQWFNQRWYDYTGGTAEEMTGWGWRKVHAPEHLARVLDKFKRAMEKGEPWEDTFPLRRHDGQMRWHLSRAIPLKDEQGRTVRWFGTNTDITERMQMEAALKDADRSKDEFLAMLAHELRNPLAPIRSGLDLLALDPRGHEETLEVMQHQVDHLVRLVDDLLDVSRIMRGRIILQKHPCELAGLVQRAVEAVDKTLQTRRHRLKLQLPETPIWLNADPVRFVQILWNLLNNAAKYTDPGGEITVTCEVTDETVGLHVRDTGIGIEPELLPKVFDLFTQSTRSLDRSQGGLGIGLTLVRNLVQMHGGQVSVHSDGRNRGSEFCLWMPRAAAPRSATGQPRQEACVPSLRILVVDDNRSATLMLSKLLMKLGAHRIEVAHDGRTALEQAQTFRPQLVLLDIGLPDIDGYEVARALRADPSFAATRLVALTGYGRAEDRRKAADSGFDQHMTKPPSLQGLCHLLADPRLAQQTAEAERPGNWERAEDRESPDDWERARTSI